MSRLWVKIFSFIFLVVFYPELKPNAGTKPLLGYTESLHGKMVQNRDLGDQEVEYIYGMAFVENMIDIRKRPDFAKFRPHKTEILLKESVGSLEKLKVELEIRYKQKRTEKKEPKVEPLPKTPELSSLLPDRKGIKCEELMKILRVAKEPLAILSVELCASLSDYEVLDLGAACANEAADLVLLDVQLHHRLDGGRLVSLLLRGGHGCLSV